MNSRNARARLAEQTVEICQAGVYHAPSGTVVRIAEALARAKAGTMLYSAGQLAAPPENKTGKATRFEVRNETTFEALARISPSHRGHIACLNFASAKNPGGGFLNGSMAQEEALACASGLYPCLLRAPDFYERNRANRSAVYLDLAIFSPRVPFFRNDTGALLPEPILASVITAPAPNAGAIARNEPGNLPLVEPALKRRAELILKIACAQDVDELVLGAWGCGVFRNSPRVVAGIFAKLLKPPGAFAGAFQGITFAVFNRSPAEETYRAFAEQFKNTR